MRDLPYLCVQHRYSRMSNGTSNVHLLARISAPSNMAIAYSQTDTLVPHWLQGAVQCDRQSHQQDPASNHWRAEILFTASQQNVGVYGRKCWLQEVVGLISRSRAEWPACAAGQSRRYKGRRHWDTVKLCFNVWPAMHTDQKQHAPSNRPCWNLTRS